jgi:hypothetical protein
VDGDRIAGFREEDAMLADTEAEEAFELTGAA